MIGFDQVVIGLKAGKRFARAEWLGDVNVPFIYLVPASSFKPQRPPLNEIKSGSIINYAAHIDICDGTNASVYNVSQDDLLYENWVDVTDLISPKKNSEKKPNFTELKNNIAKYRVELTMPNAEAAAEQHTALKKAIDGYSEHNIRIAVADAQCAMHEAVDVSEKILVHEIGFTAVYELEENALKKFIDLIKGENKFLLRELDDLPYPLESSDEPITIMFAVEHEIREEDNRGSYIGLKREPL